MSPRARFVTGVLSVLLLVVAFGAYFYLRSGSMFSPEGTLLLSLAPKGSTEVNLYEFAVESKTLTRVGRDGNSHYDGKFSPDGSRIAHIAYGPGALASQVIVYDPSTGVRQVITRGEGFRHSPDWSPVGAGLAFSEEAKGGSDVYAANLPESPRRLGPGSYPLWSLDGKSLFALTKEGLVRYSLAEGGVSHKVWGATGSGMKLAASRDHSLLSWMIPSAGTVMLFKANAARPQELVLNKTLNIKAYDIAFSPDNEYAAMRVLSDVGGQHFEVVIVNLETGETRTVLDLSPYEMKTLYLTSWK